MKATGIVRRIDDLGRVVIPKEIRRTLRIREGDPLEIYTSADGSITLKNIRPFLSFPHMPSSSQKCWKTRFPGLCSSAIKTASSQHAASCAKL